MGVANVIKPGSAELDPRSADFGKIKVGNTRFDISGGMGSLITLAARLITMSSKSSITGGVYKLNSGKYGSQTGMDVATNFFENKLSPIGSLVKDLLKQTDFSGSPITVQGEASNLFMPLPITNAYELLKTPNAAPFLLGIIADGLGIATNTYAPKKKTSNFLKTKKTKFP